MERKTIVSTWELDTSSNGVTAAFVHISVSGRTRSGVGKPTPVFSFSWPRTGGGRGPRLGLVVLISWLFLVPPAASEDVYQSREDFLSEAFAGDVPKAKTLWIKKGMRERINQIMKRTYKLLRVRYWQRGDRTAWILEEIGKVKPITTGLVVDGGSLERIKVLIYRESHGWEVRHAFFTDQFKGVRLSDGKRLNKSIDGISGATLSVNALTNLGTIALYLHEFVMAKND